MTDQEAAKPRETSLADFQAMLERADAIWRLGDPARLAEGVQVCDRALAALGVLGAADENSMDDREPADETAERGRLEAAFWLKRGHLLESLAVAEGRSERLIEALRGYDRALERLQKIPAERGGEALAGAWMNRGNALQKLGSGAAAAARCYERTLAILQELRTAEPAALARLGLTRGAAWLNLGVARRTLAEAAGAEAANEGGPAAPGEAFERAIAELEPWAGRQPAARRNLAAAWTNLGLARMPKDAADAVAAHAEALRIAEAQAAERAALLTNLAQARLAAGDEARARDELREALRLAAEREDRDAGAADAGLRARHALCVALGVAPERDEAARREAAALVESGLALAAAWEGRAPWLRGTASRLFEYGAWLHRARGGVRLAEWLLAHLHEADEARLRLAAAAVLAARQEILQRGFESLVGPGSAAVGEDLAALRAAEERVRALASTVRVAPGAG